jgi:hypothetical protein
MLPSNVSDGARLVKAVRLLPLVVGSRDLVAALSDEVPPKVLRSLRGGVGGLPPGGNRQLSPALRLNGGHYKRQLRASPPVESKIPAVFQRRTSWCLSRASASGGPPALCRLLTGLSGRIHRPLGHYPCQSAQLGCLSPEVVTRSPSPRKVDVIPASQGHQSASTSLAGSVVRRRLPVPSAFMM